MTRTILYLPPLLKEKRCPYCKGKLRTILVYRKMVIRFRLNNYGVETDLIEVKCPRCGSDIKDKLDSKFKQALKEYLKDEDRIGL